MLTVPIITALSTSVAQRARRSALWQLRNRLGVLTVEADTRTLLDRRWDWLETQNVPERVMVFLDLIFDRTGRTPRREGVPDFRPWNIHRDRPEMGRLLAWLARVLTEHGIPTGKDTYDYRMHDVVVEGLYGALEDVMGPDEHPNEIYIGAWDDADERTVDLPWELVGILAPYHGAPDWHHNQRIEVIDTGGRLPESVGGHLLVEWSVEGGPRLTLTRSTPGAGDFTVSVTIFDRSRIISDLQDAMVEVELSGLGIITIEQLARDVSHVETFLEGASTERLTDQLLWLDSMHHHITDGMERMLFLRETMRWATTLWIDRVINVLIPTGNAVTSIIRDWLVAEPGGLAEIDTEHHDHPLRILVNRATDRHREAFIHSHEVENEPLEETEEGRDFTVLRRFSDGASIIEILTTSAMRHEGADMGHCIGTEKWGHPEDLRAGRVRVFSYRRPDEKPRATLEVSNEAGLPTRDLQGPYNGPIPGDEARIRMAWFAYETRAEGLMGDPYPHTGDLAGRLLSFVPEARDGGRLEPRDKGIILHGWPLYHTMLEQPPAPGYPKLEVTLECRCADDRGRMDRPTKDGEDDRACIEDYQETLARHQALEQMIIPAHVRVYDSTDRDSRHSDCYLDFEIGDIVTVVEALDEVGLLGDILDVWGDVDLMHPALRSWIYDGLGWEIQENDPR